MQHITLVIKSFFVLGEIPFSCVQSSSSLNAEVVWGFCWIAVEER